MRTSSGQLYLIDFGAARYFKPGQSKDTIPLGSPGYAAPEQYGRAQTTPRADVYSLGALLHHLISRRDPSETPFSFAPLSAYGPTGLSELETLVLRMVELDSERRPADIAEVEAELRRIREPRAAAEPRIWRAVPGQVPPPVLAPGAYLPPPVRQQMQQHMQAVTTRKKKTRRTFLVGGLAVASSLALGGFSYWRYWHPGRLVLDSRFSRSLSSPLFDISTIAWSVDGTCVAFGADDGSIVVSRFLNTHGRFSSGFSTSTFPLTNTPTQPINALAWSPDNTSLLVLTQDGQLQVRDSNLQKISTLATAITTAAWAPNGINIFALNEQGDGLLFLYNPDTGAGLPLGSRGLNLRNVLAWSPDGTRIAAEQVMEPGSHVLLIMSTDVDQMDTSISPGPSTTTALTWSPDGHYLAALDVTGTLQVWDMQNSNNLVFSKSITTQQNQLAWSTDSRFLAAIDDANELLVLDRSSGDTLVSAPIADPPGRGSAFPGRALTWLDSQHIALASNNMEYWIWDVPWF
jgi:WD40 repeat protein